MNNYLVPKSKDFLFYCWNQVFRNPRQEDLCDLLILQKEYLPRKRWPSVYMDIPPGVWPGVCITLRVTFPKEIISPSFTSLSAPGGIFSFETKSSRSHRQFWKHRRILGMNKDFCSSSLFKLPVCSYMIKWPCVFIIYWRENLSSARAFSISEGSSLGQLLRQALFPHPIIKQLAIIGPTGIPFIITFPSFRFKRVIFLNYLLVAGFYKDYYYIILNLQSTVAEWLWP